MRYEGIREAKNTLIGRFGVMEDRRYFEVMRKVPKQQVSQAVQIKIFARDFDPEFGTDGEESSISIFSNTFALSSNTSFEVVRRAACSYWGVFLNDFQLYFLDGNGSIYDLGQENVKVLRFLETFGQSAAENDANTKNNSKSKNKGKKVAMKKSYAIFYLGRKVTMVP